MVVEVEKGESKKIKKHNRAVYRLGTLALDLDGKLLEVLVVRDVLVDEPADELGRVVAKLFPPLLVLGRWGGDFLGHTQKKRALC